MNALQTIMLSCAKATEYLNLREEGQLNAKQNLQLKLHLLACKTCKAYEKQSQILKNMFGAYQEKQSKPLKNEKLKRGLKAKLEEL
jgi:hypothetical protein